MQFSELWLRSFVNPSHDSEALAHLLTMAGLEVEEQDPVAPAFDQVVVAQVLTTEKHPDADRLKVCSVDIGQNEPLQIVCGAPNVAPGLKVPCALVGAKLPDISIKKAKVRGIESFGMLCSARELGLTQEEQGGLLILETDAVVGQSIRAHLQLDDCLLTLKLTPNRADCLSLRGIAREVAALTETPLKQPPLAPAPLTHTQTRSIELLAPAACPRYCGRIIDGVNASVATPAWMVQRLERSGVRSISAIVDITNYVMLELGQPLHAFDDAYLQGNIQVRYPQPEEQLTLLNGQTPTPSHDTLLIADQGGPGGNGRALALAGIMGGVASGVTTASTRIFLESAFFTPTAIAGKARALGFGTDAAYRFERGVDFELPRDAMERASQLILDICGGSAGPISEAVAPEHLPQRHPVRLRCKRARKLLGIELETARIGQLLSGLGMPLAQEGEDYIVTPPSFRFDIEREVDLIEELARLYGYDNIPAPAPRGRLAMQALPEEQRPLMQLRHLLAERDYFEVVNYSFVEAQWEADFYANTSPIQLANPIASQLCVMRSGLIGGLVNTLAFNLKRRTQRVRIFEIGRAFLRAADAQPVPGFAQPQRLAVLCAGPVVPMQWGEATRNADFYDLKGDLEAWLAPRELRFEKAEHPALHPGRAATVLIDGQIAGIIGELHPSWVQKYELTSPPILCELELATLLRQPLPQYQAVSRYPSVERDLALLVAATQPLQPLLDAMRGAAPGIVQRLDLFDQYHGKGIDPDQKSLAFHIVMQDTSGTLADADCDAAMQQLLDAAQAFGATLRH